MPRPAKHNEARILKAAASLVAARGPSAATITAIGHAIGAPNGSIYHRFRSRDELLGRLWLTAAASFQNTWVQALEHPDARTAGLEAALSLPRTTRRDLQGARILLLHRREDFLSNQWPLEMREEARRLGQQVKGELNMMTRRLFGRSTITGRQIVTFAILDLPFSAVRRFVSANEPPPGLIDELITKSYLATLESAEGLMK